MLAQPIEMICFWPEIWNVQLQNDDLNPEGGDLKQQHLNNDEENTMDILLARRAQTWQT